MAASVVAIFLNVGLVCIAPVDDVFRNHVSIDSSRSSPIRCRRYVSLWIGKGRKTFQAEDGQEKVSPHLHILTDSVLGIQGYV